MSINNQVEPVKGRELPQWLVFTFVALMTLGALLVSTGNISWLPENAQAAIKNNFGGSPSEGAAGPQGPQGLQGEPGPTGPMGPQGLSGDDGTPGEIGPKGETGASGAQGPTGQTGLAGESGIDGASGPMGPIGLTGAAGPQGEKGDTGTTGATGPQGEQGLQGPRGATGATGLQGIQGIQGIQGPPGGFGSYGSFYDNADHALTALTATPIPLNSTDFASGISIVDTYKIKIANAGKYNIAFSSQITNTANANRTITIWLSKNGIAQINWVAETSTDIVLGKDTLNERSVAAWNFFVNAASDDFYVLMIVANGSGVTIDGGLPTNTTPANIPSIPSTILTVNQVG